MSDDAWQSIGDVAANLVAKIHTDKLDRARALRANGLSYGRIVAATGLSMYALKCEFEPGYKARVADSVRRGSEARRRGRIQQQRRTPRTETPLEPIIGAGNTAIIQPPADVLADRDRRMAMSPRSVIAALQGDPEPGRQWPDGRSA